MKEQRLLFKCLYVRVGLLSTKQDVLILNSLIIMILPIMHTHVLANNKFVRNC